MSILVIFILDRLKVKILKGGKVFFYNYLVYIYWN